MDMYIPYCPGQAPMGTHIKGTIKRGWVVAQKRCLDGSTPPMQASIPDAKTTEPGYQTTLHCHFTRANVRYLQCANVVLKVKNVVNKATDWCVWNLAAVCCGNWSVSNNYTVSLCKNLAWWVVRWGTLKTTYLSKLKASMCTGMGACMGQYNT